MTSQILKLLDSSKAQICWKQTFFWQMKKLIHYTLRAAIREKTVFKHRSPLKFFCSLSSERDDIRLLICMFPWLLKFSILTDAIFRNPLSFTCFFPKSTINSPHQTFRVSQLLPAEVTLSIPSSYYNNAFRNY